MDSLPPKTCYRCGETALEPHKSFNVNRRYADGLDKLCRNCTRAAGKKQYAKHPEKAKANAKAYAEKNPVRVTEQRRKNYEENKERILAEQKIYKAENPEKVKEGRKRHYQQNRDAVRAQQKVYSQRNSAAIVARAALWAADNPEKTRQYKSKNRAKRIQALGTHTAQDVAKQFALQGGKCYWCGSKLKKSGKDKFHVDHRTALVLGGSNGPENIVCSCPTCNLRKGKKTPLEFAGRLF